MGHVLDLFRKIGVKLGAEEELFFMGVCVSVSSEGGEVGRWHCCLGSK